MMISPFRISVLFLVNGLIYFTDATFLWTID